MSNPIPNRSFYKLPAREAMIVARRASVKDGMIDPDILKDWTNKWRAGQKRRERQLVFQERLALEDRPAK